MHNIYLCKKKRKNSDDDDHDENEAPKKARKQYEINPEWRAAMDKDTRNKKMWDQVATLFLSLSQSFNLSLFSSRDQP